MSLRIQSATNKNKMQNFDDFWETGCGKSTFLNAIINKFTDIDPEDDLRYQIILENDENVKFSLTKDVTEYYIRDNLTKTVYRLKNTPGFGDT
jgi:ABC-type phosphate transport system ATPase subunit